MGFKMFSESFLRFWDEHRVEGRELVVLVLVSHMIEPVLEWPGGFPSTVFVDPMFGAVSYTHLTLPTILRV